MGVVLQTRREDAIDVLCAHHQSIRELLEAVDDEQPGSRRRVVDRLCRCLASHEAAEGLLLRPVTRSCVVGGEVIADARLAEEQEAKRMLDELSRPATDPGQFLAAFGDFKRRLLEHMDSEESYEFPLVRAGRDENALVALGTVLRRGNPPARSMPADPSALAGAVITPLTSAVGKLRRAVLAARS